MGNPTKGGTPTPKAALLVIIPPILLIALAVIAIKCSEWWPRIKVNLNSCLNRSRLFRGRKRSGSDFSDSSSDTEAIPVT